MFQVTEYTWQGRAIAVHYVATSDEAVLLSVIKTLRKFDGLGGIDDLVALGYLIREGSASFRNWNDGAFDVWRIA